MPHARHWPRSNRTVQQDTTNSVTNFIYGFADFATELDETDLRQSLGENTPLGVFSERKDQLHGFPPELSPSDQAFLFAIGDSTRWPVATYLLDYQDYDPAADIGLPISAYARLALLVTLLTRMFDDFGAIRVVVLLTLCSEVDEIKHISVKELSQTFHADCEIESPPCLLYVIHRERR